MKFFAAIGPFFLVNENGTKTVLADTYAPFVTSESDLTEREIERIGRLWQTFFANDAFDATITYPITPDSKVYRFEPTDSNISHALANFQIDQHRALLLAAKNHTLFCNQRISANRIFLQDEKTGKVLCEWLA